MPLQRCRVWLPEHLCQIQPCSIALVGWVNWNKECLDLVVAATCTFEQLGLQRTRLCHLSTLLPDELKKGIKPSFVGTIRCSRSSNGVSPNGRPVSAAPQVWAEVAITTGQRKEYGIRVFPVLERLQLHGVVCKPDVHMIMYDQPRLGSHHFCSRPWEFFDSRSTVEDGSTEVNTLLKKMRWISILGERQAVPNVDRILLQLNCSRFIDEGITQTPSTTPEKLETSLSFSISWYFLAALLAAIGTGFFFFARAGSVLLDIVHTKSSISSHTVRNVLHRCIEMKAWPMTLFWGGPGPNLPNISVVHRLSVLRYRTGVALCVDILLGVLSGIVLLLHRVHIEHYLWRMAQFVTNDILRSGCIWLMGVPAGFKLNTELTGLLGTLSLQVIHTWSSLCYLLAPVLPIWLQVVAVSGMLMGFTIHIAMTVDMLLFFTLHISILHQALAFAYSTQLQTLASLLRLFRGLKRNPLRSRLDSYDCTAEQIVVASLMFTPLLLLLPTVSGFYMYFTILHVSISAVSFTLQLLIQCVHVCPYVELGIWLVHPQRFPSGIWFQTLSPDNPHLSGLKCCKNCDRYDPSSATGQIGSGSREPLKPSMLDQQQDASDADHLGGVEQFSRLMSKVGQERATAGCNINIWDCFIAAGEILMPFFTHLYGGLGLSRLTGHIHGVLSGRRLPASLCFGCSPPLPQPSMTVARFWGFCFEALSHAAGETRRSQ